MAMREDSKDRIKFEVYKVRPINRGKPQKWRFTGGSETEPILYTLKGLAKILAIDLTTRESRSRPGPIINDTNLISSRENEIVNDCIGSARQYAPLSAEELLTLTQLFHGYYKEMKKTKY